MQKAGIIFLLLFFTFRGVVHSQVDEIKTNSDRNSESRDNNRHNNSSDRSYYNDDNDDDNCVSSLITECCTSILTEVITSILSDISAGLWAQKEEKPRIGSADFIGMAGLSIPRNPITVPRVRYNAAIYSTDLRVYTNYEGDVNGINTYSTIDWQILMLNLVILDEVNFRIGTGLLYEYYANIVFNEHTANLDIYPDDLFKVNIEYRFAPDYETKNIVRNEINIGLYYKIKQWNRSDMYVFGNYMGSKYYQTVWLDQAAIGVQFSIY